MKEIQMKELQRMIKFITGAGCKFKIITPDGEEFGELEVKPVKTRAKRNLERPYGELINFYKPQIDFNAPVGSVQEINPGTYPAMRIQSGVCSLLHKEWGKDNYTTCVNTKTNKVEVLRIAEKGE